jgi:hypothetical protein
MVGAAYASRVTRVLSGADAWTCAAARTDGNAERGGRPRWIAHKARISGLRGSRRHAGTANGAAVAGVDAVTTDLVADQIRTAHGLPGDALVRRLGTGLYAVAIDSIIARPRRSCAAARLAAIVGRAERAVVTRGTFCIGPVTAVAFGVAHFAGITGIDDASAHALLGDAAARTGLRAVCARVASGQRQVRASSAIFHAFTRAIFIAARGPDPV